MICSFCGDIVKAVLSVHVSTKRKKIKCACVNCLKKAKGEIYDKMSVRMRERYFLQEGLEGSKVCKQGSFREVESRTDKTGAISDVKAKQEI